MERNCNFFVMVNTGEQPDTEIHCAGFDEEDGIAVVSQLKGGMRDLAQMVASLVEKFGAEIQEKQGMVGAVAFVNMIGEAMAKSIDRKAVEYAAMLNTPEKMFEKLAKLIEEEDDDDAEFV